MFVLVVCLFGTRPRKLARFVLTVSTIVPYYSLHESEIKICSLTRIEALNYALMALVSTAFARLSRRYFLRFFVTFYKLFIQAGRFPFFINDMLFAQ